jgi:transcriptional regulator of acetoin/glycerol metabolism
VAASVHVTHSATGNRLAEARERFLTDDRVDSSQVRNPILASWWRSRDWHVAADRVRLPYIRDPDLGTPLARSALPVLRSLRENLQGQPISVILTDASGFVLSRMTADHDLERHLDGVQLAPGFSYAEEYVGTNGIGTALEAAQPAHVFGHEHYAEDLEDLACAGVPIHDPLTGKTLGAVDLTCWRRDADPLLIALAKTTADQITQALLVAASGQEVMLLQEYLRACRRSSGIVLAMNAGLVMMNDYAREVLDPADQAAVISLAAEALAGGHARALTADLPSGTTARMHCRPVHGNGRVVGGIVHVKLVEQPPGQVTDTGPKAPMVLPGLIGSAPIWLRGCRQVEAVCESGEWLAVEGEPGVGKLAVVRAVHQRYNPVSRFFVLDTADAGQPEWLARTRHELLEAAGTLVIRHVEALGPRHLHALASAFQEARSSSRPRSLWVVATLRRAGNGSGDHRGAGGDLTRLLRFFPRTVEVPPLRHHIEDLHELVPFFLAKLSQHGRLTCAPEAMQLLLRSNWPGNTEQLWQVLKRVVQHRRTGAIYAKDLPPECWTVSRRLLSQLESMERDAIVQALLDFDGNKVRAAESLGMSRATIYRKIREYRIVTPGS